MFGKDFTFSKRLLGILLLLIGIAGVLGLLLLDSITGSEGGIGPAQRLGFIVLALTALVGLSLIPLGNTPA